MCVVSHVALSVIVNARSSLRRSCKERLRPIKDCVSRSSHRLQLSRATGPTTRPTPPPSPPRRPSPARTRAVAAALSRSVVSTFREVEGAVASPPPGLEPGQNSTVDTEFYPANVVSRNSLKSPASWSAPPLVGWSAESVRAVAKSSHPQAHDHERGHHPITSVWPSSKSSMCSRPGAKILA